MDYRIRHSGYDTTKSRSIEQSGSTERKYGAGTGESNESYGNHGGTGKPGQPTEFAGHPCSRPSGFSRVMGTDIRQNPGSQRASAAFASRQIRYKCTPPQLPSPCSRSSGVHSPEDFLENIARACVDIFRNEKIIELRFMKNVTYPEIKNVLNKLGMKSGIVWNLKGLKADGDLSQEQQQALRDVVRHYELSKVGQKLNAENVERAKMPASAININRHYDKLTQAVKKTRRTHESHSEATPSPHSLPVRQGISIKSPVHIRTEPAKSAEIQSKDASKLSKIIANIRAAYPTIDDVILSRIQKNFNYSDFDAETVEYALHGGGSWNARGALEAIVTQCQILETRLLPSSAAEIKQHPAFDFSGVGDDSDGAAAACVSGPVRPETKENETGTMLSDDAKQLQLKMKLIGLGIDFTKSFQIIALEPDKMQIGQLDHTLKYEIGLDDKQAHGVLECVFSRDEIDRLMNTRHKADMEDQAIRAEQADRLKQVKEKEAKIAKFDYENNLTLALEFSLRDISKPQYDVLAIGSQIDDRTGKYFTKQRTVFADAQGHSDLNGDIHVTVDQIPPGKKFKEIHFTGLPGYVFDDASANQCLFQKLNNLMEDNGKLLITFGEGAHHKYDNKKFIESILIPTGFGHFNYSNRYSAIHKYGVRLSACKVQSMSSSSPKVAESSPTNSPHTLTAVGGDSRSVKVAAPQTHEKASGNQLLQEVYSSRKEQLIHIMQSRHRSFDHGLVEEVLQTPRKPEFDLSAEEFANLKVRYDQWKAADGQCTGLPVPSDITNFDQRFREAKKWFEADVGNALLTKPVPPLKSAPSFSNGAIDRQIDQIVGHLSGLDVGTESLKKIKTIFRQLPIDRKIIQNAACGSIRDLHKIQMAYAKFAFGSVQSSPAVTSRMPVHAAASPTHPGGSDDVIDGATASPPARSERPIAQAPVQWDQLHEQVFRSGLNALLAAPDDELPLDAAPPSLIDAIEAIRAQNQAGRQEIDRLANAESYPVKGYAHGQVSVMQGAGIQAAGNNCAIASVLMGMSHQGSLRLLIGQIQQAVKETQRQLANLPKYTFDVKAERDHRMVLEALGRLKDLDSVLVQYDSQRLGAIRVNDNLNDIRTIFGLAKGVNLEPDEFFERMITDLRTLQSFTQSKGLIEIFNFPVHKQRELAGKDMNDAFNLVYLDEIARDSGARVEDPDVLLLSPPTYGRDQRSGISLSDKVQKYHSDGTCTEYQLAGSVNISETHYVTFLRDDKNGLLYLANSMGMHLGSNDHEPFTVPTVITMPINGTARALDEAILNTKNEADGALMRQTKEQWENLSNNCRLAIYTKVKQH
ncbi:hypothetical protein [Endozoicomonas sp. SCSIO W0465]|uniref:hypothetical protein n=1 Tax=Endozoicomonas sp. SCSIO W0465 TaxID=2918516 RepID=UPI002076266F|nr:hypothetical protein [Endozoicomonas sp. SCSIO W0465]USE36492.1 hypothetical protein MJO57_31515 [Endozoicomonas sp. SCSIO W0465]